MIHFDLPKEKSSIIKVIGVGGGGSNAVNHMFSQHIEGVNFIICNTDAQALAQSHVPNKIQLGPHLTQGLGAGANPDIGRQATEESLEEIKKILEVNTKMAFITVGMGGGTGTGGGPIIAKICKDLGILTVGIITMPFSYEGKKRQLHAEEGIKVMKQYVDTLLVISNDKLRHQFGNLKMKEAFAKADNVLATAAKCITDVINSTGQINVDFADVCTVMRNGGVAILGSAAAKGEGRAQKAIEEALNSPLLNDSDIRGAKWILININSCEGEHEFTMDEVEIIQNHLLDQAGESTDIILGLGYDNALGPNLGITLIATGFEHKDPFSKSIDLRSTPKKEEKILMTLNVPEEEPRPEKRPVLTNSETTKETSKSIHRDTPALEQVPTQASPAHMITPVAVASPAPMIIEWVIAPEPQASQTESLPLEPAAPVISGGYLARPVNIYDEDNDALTNTSVSARTMPEPEDVSNDMHLVFKDELSAVDEPGAHQTQLVTPAGGSAEEPAPQDDAEDPKRRAAERINKLRNLSFNINAADPNNEFETVPAYIRRNLELYNTISSVENFYSNYEVKTDENNNTEISTINTFLDGKRPD